MRRDRYDIVSSFFEAIGESASELRRAGKEVRVSQVVDLDDESTSLGFRIGGRAVSNYDKLGKAIIQNKSESKLNAPALNRDPNFQCNTTFVPGAAAPANPFDDCPFCLVPIGAQSKLKKKSTTTPSADPPKRIV